MNEPTRHPSTHAAQNEALEKNTYDIWTIEKLSFLSVSDLKDLLGQRGLDASDCIDKNDLMRKLIMWQNGQINTVQETINHNEIEQKASTHFESQPGSSRQQFYPNPAQTFTTLPQFKPQYQQTFSQSQLSQSTTTSQPASNVTKVSMENFLANPETIGKRPIAEVQSATLNESTKKSKKVDDVLTQQDMNQSHNFPQNVQEQLNIKRNVTLNEAEKVPSVSNGAAKTLRSSVIPTLVKLDSIPEVPPLTKLTLKELNELEKLLQFNDKYNNHPDNEWKHDWSGNLQLLEKDIVVNRDKLVDKTQTKPLIMSFREWLTHKAKDGSYAVFRGIRLLFSHIYNMEGTPPMAKKLLAYAMYRRCRTPEEFMGNIMKVIRRISYDPIVLEQDGWTIMRSSKPEGASGGANLIGRKILWHRFEAVVIAFVKDEEIGDLWKAIWLEDLETFDLEADELHDAIKRWDAKEARRLAKLAPTQAPTRQQSSGGIASSKPSKNAGVTRFAATNKFTVDGIEHGIVLAVSYHPNARPNIFWPARVLHFTEHKALGNVLQASRRGTSNNKLPIVFLAPYWNTQSSKKADVLQTKSIFSTGPLYEFDSADLSSNSIKKYPYTGDLKEISIEKLRSEFKFLGLPKTAFPRFLDAHRLALSLKAFVQEQIYLERTKSGSNEHAGAYAALTDSHPMSVKAPIMPPVLLSLPFEYIISSLPPPPEFITNGEEVKEPIIQLNSILKALKPPLSWGRGIPVNESVKENRENEKQSENSVVEVKSMSETSKLETKEQLTTWMVENFSSKLLLDNINQKQNVTAARQCLGTHLQNLISRLNYELSTIKDTTAQQKSSRLSSFVDHCMITKGLGDDAISERSIPSSKENKTLKIEWRKACERIYRCAISSFSYEGVGDGVSYVLTDYRCNNHLTSAGSYERPVRVPAAVRAAKLAGCGKNDNFKLITKIDEKYIQLAENKVLSQAHKLSYIKRMKAKISALSPDVIGAPLTDDSDEEGGEDTMGSRGSYTAAVTGIGAALQAIDMVMNGDCVNVFCAVRPPGHHAGRDLRAMDAMSNGFCLFNGAACAAIYATTPISEGGRGLRRACIIDFDVHHGNGTQDVLCSEYDPRFLYVSLHAGGSQINGCNDDEDNNKEGFSYRRGDSNKKPEGIFPGRCGDTSPHPGVLNIPLGQKVTAPLAGNALVNQVAPALEAFSPDIVILSAGFDGHKNDPMGLGGLNADDFGCITDVVCQMAAKTCSGRVISILEGGYGVPCCRPRRDIFLPTPWDKSNENGDNIATEAPDTNYLGDDLPKTMDDEVPSPLQHKLERCVAEGFLDAVREHVASLARNNKQNGKL